jgi:hypothetical protein
VFVNHSVGICACPSSDEFAWVDQNLVNVRVRAHPARQDEQARKSADDDAHLDD